MATATAGTISSLKDLKDFLTDKSITETLDATSYTEGVYGQYAAAKTAAEGLISRPGLGGGPAASPLNTLIDTLKAHTKGHETVVESLEGALASDSKDFKRIVKEHQRILKENAGELSNGIKEALGAHKEAHKILVKEHTEVTRELAGAYSEAIAAAADNAEKAEITKKFKNIQSSLGTFFDRQKAVHERAADHMKDIVEALGENGVTLKHKFNFDITAKEVAEKGTKVGENIVEHATPRAEDVKAASKSMTPILVGAGVGAGLGYAVGGEDNKLMTTVVGAGAGAGVGALIRGFNKGGEAAIGAVGKVADLAPNLANQAIRHI